MDKSDAENKKCNQNIY